MKFSMLFMCGTAISGAFGQGFKHSCHDPILYKPHTLGAECQRADGSWMRRSFIDLNECLVTRAGWLYFQSRGHAFDACADPELKDSSGDKWVIGAWCPSDGHKSEWEWSLKDMNEIIGNTNGQLRCYDNYGGQKFAIAMGNVTASLKKVSTIL